MAFIPRSSNQISLLSFSPAVCKAQTRSGSSQHLMAATKHLSESCFLPSACIAGLSPSLKGNRDFLRFRAHARDQNDSELSAHLEPLAADVSKNKDGADVFLPASRSRFEPHLVV